MTGLREKRFCKMKKFEIESIEIITPNVLRRYQVGNKVSQNDERIITTIRENSVELEESFAFIIEVYSDNEKVLDFYNIPMKIEYKKMSDR